MIEELEKHVQAKCDSLVRQCGGEAVHLSQARPSKLHVGLPDRRYRIHGVAFWFECKAPQGRLSRRQIEFMEYEYQCGAICACGGVEEVRAMIVAAKRGYVIAPHVVTGLSVDMSAREYGYDTLQRWIARGVRT